MRVQTIRLFKPKYGNKANTADDAIFASNSIRTTGNPVRYIAFEDGYLNSQSSSNLTQPKTQPMHLIITCML